MSEEDRYRGDPLRQKVAAELRRHGLPIPRDEDGGDAWGRAFDVLLSDIWANHALAIGALHRAIERLSGSRPEDDDT